jgi:hypothetical protein
MLRFFCNVSKNNQLMGVSGTEIFWNGWRGAANGMFYLYNRA